MARELLLQERYRIDQLLALPEWLDAQTDLLRRAGIQGEAINAADLGRVSTLTTPNQVLAVVDIPPPGEQPWSAWSLLLDGIQDPGNLGAILRVADWFGFRTVLAAPGTVDPYNPKAIQAGMGAFLRIDYREIELSDLPESISLLGADMEGNNVFTAELPKEGILAIGNEGQGLRPAIRERVTGYLRIPAAAAGGMESLNAAVATGVLCAVISQRVVGPPK